MKTSILLTGLLLTIVTMPGTSFAKGGEDPSPAFIAKQFDIWNAALQTGDANKVAALYCEPGGVLIPTVSDIIRTDRSEIADYFVHFLELKPNGVIDKAYIRVLGPDTGINSGLYTFHVIKEGKPADVHARYTFVYQKQQGNWCIIEHHSSVMPETAQPSQH